jgi:SAM-dependent methyltransferase
LETVATKAGLSEEAYRRDRIGHWSRVATRKLPWGGARGSYQRRLAAVYALAIPPAQRVLEIGCETGDLLASLKPSFGVGVDFTHAALREARRRHPSLRFVEADAHALPLSTAGGSGAAGPPLEEFDFIVLSDLVNDLWDVQRVLEGLGPLVGPRTRVVLNFFSHLWELPLRAASRLGAAQSTLRQNWLTPEDVRNLLRLANLDVVKQWEEVLLPLDVPLIAPFLNKFLVRLWPFRHLALSNVMTVRSALPSPAGVRPAVAAAEALPSVSVVVPARNEEGNIENIFRRVPSMGRGTEIVFVEGHSKDATYATILAARERHPEVDCQVLQQTGIGKGDAMRLGFERARGEVLMILDADLTVPPEDLPRFYDALVSRKGDFINGVRLVYPMEQQAMRFINLAGNKFFSAAFSWLLGQPVRDTLCGTKVLWKKDYERIAANRAAFGEFDPFGDFDLLFGAARLGLRIVDVPIRYRERTYGETNIQRWRHGWLLLRMVGVAARRLKFV